MARPSELPDFTALSSIERGATPDQIILRDQSAGLLVGVDATLFLREIDPTVIALTSSTALVSATHNHAIITNTGASSLNTHTLWAAVIGDEITFVRRVAQIIRVDPNGTNTIGDGAAGKYLELQNSGAIRLRSFATGTWDIVSASCVYEYEQP